MKKQKTIMILGVHHLDSPNNGDMYTYKSGNIESEKRQSEIKELIMCLKEFNPTKIALEVDKEINKLIIAILFMQSLPGVGVTYAFANIHPLIKIIILIELVFSGFLIYEGYSKTDNTK